jgi:hypothetical protein
MTVSRSAASMAETESPIAPGNDNTGSTMAPRHLSSSERKVSRDQARGYSINVKQVVLAFLIEFTIIGLILTSQYLIASEQGTGTLEALLFPIALAMVELARVPLALAVRTQRSWSVKFAATVGVLSAVVVTSFSLSTIAYRTFDPRLTQANDSHNDWLNLTGRRKSLLDQKVSADTAIEQKLKERDSTNELIKTTTVQVPTDKAQICTTVSVPNPTPGGLPGTRQVCKDNPALKPLQAELANLNIKVKDIDASLKMLHASADHARQELMDFDDKISNAEAAYREKINHSQLHSYTAMLFQKDPRDVSDAEVKTLEWYLIIVPSIAAAFASTLIAITAIRRIAAEPNSAVSIPDDAATYLFGPLLTAIKAEARATVLAAMNGQTKAPLAAE